MLEEQYLDLVQHLMLLYRLNYQKLSLLWVAKEYLVIADRYIELIIQQMTKSEKIFKD